MRIYKCDICGKDAAKDKGGYLGDLPTEYQTKKIKEACKDCLEKIQAHTMLIESYSAKSVKSFIRGLVKKHKGGQ